jgi:hypothetical protein
MTVASILHTIQVLAKAPVLRPESTELINVISLITTNFKFPIIYRHGYTQWSPHAASKQRNCIRCRPLLEYKKNCHARGDGKNGQLCKKRFHKYTTIAKLKLSHYTPRKPLGERMHSSYSFSTSALDGGEWSASRPAALCPRGKEPRYPLYRRMDGPQSRSGHKAGGRILSPLPGIEPQSPGRPARSQTLYWLSYPAHSTSLRFLVKTETRLNPA